MNNSIAIVIAPEVKALSKSGHALTQRISRSITTLVRAGNISGPEIEALGAIAAGYGLLTEPRRTARRQQVYERDMAKKPEEECVASKGKSFLDALPPLLDIDHLEQDFLAWWTRLQNQGLSICMPVVLDVAVEGLSLTRVGEKRHCDKRTAKTRLILGLRHYIATGGVVEQQDVASGEAGDQAIEEDPEGALRDAVSRVGGQSALARLIGTNQQNISYWLKKGETSIKFARAVADATGIPAARLRPDVFGIGVNRNGSRGSLDGVADQDFDDPRIQWVDDLPRCPLCRILVTDGAPPSPCYRQGCIHAVCGDYASTFSAPSSLSGEDYTFERNFRL
jgi:DNA-binding transcriptional regulator YdaS (Cro superfamily)